MIRFADKKSLLLAFICLFLLLVLVSAARAESPIPKPSGPVNDFAGVLSPAYRDRLIRLTNEVYQKTGIPVIVAIVPDLGGAEYNEYANRIYNDWGIGKKGEDKGVLIFVAVKERKMRIETGYGVEGILPDGLVGEIRDRYMIPYLKKNDFNEGLLNGTKAISKIIADDAGVTLTGETAPKPAKKENPPPLFLLFIFFALFFFFLALRKRRGTGLAVGPFLLGGGGSPQSGGFGSSFGGFSGGFGGFGGGMSGGGGAGGSF
jgi:uncharacterized protein